MSTVRTVLGDVEPSTLGRTDYHEHLFQVSPLLAGDELDDELDDEAASGAEALLLRSSGFHAMVDATPVGLGRDPEAVARISLAADLSVVSTTGAHREEHYPADHWLRGLDVAQRAEMFLGDLIDGMPRSDGPGDRGGALAVGPSGTPVRAGMLKAGVGYWSITSFERATLEAIGAAHVASGAPVMVHLEFCTAAHEVLDLLGDHGVAAGSIVLAHADRDPNPSLHLELASRGAWLGYDGMARPRTRSDAELLELTASVVAAGGEGHILLGGDVARRTHYAAYGGMPGLAYLGDRYLPRLRERVGDDVVDAILTTNPQRFLTWRAPRRYSSSTT